MRMTRGDLVVYRPDCTMQRIYATDATEIFGIVLESHPGGKIIKMLATCNTIYWPPKNDCEKIVEPRRSSQFSCPALDATS